MKYLLVLASVLLLVAGCAKGPVGADGVDGGVGPAGPAASVIPESTTQQLVDAENAYREGLGQTALTLGLSCTVQLSGNAPAPVNAPGQWLSSSSPGYNAAQGLVTALAGSASYAYLLQTSFNQPDSPGNVTNGLIPTAIQPLFIGQNYKINCAGQIVVTDSGYYGFDVNSDDGSILTIDGSVVIYNDGNHAMTDKSGTKFLRSGVHTFNMAYAQSGGGNFGLILQANGAVVPATAFYH